MKFKQYVTTALYNLKNEISTDVSPTIPVMQDGKQIATLRVITKSMLNDDNVVELLTKWRSEHQDAFPSQFKVTHEGTKRWGQKQLLDLPDRILFFLETPEGKPYAHLGLYRFDFGKKSCEIDNIVRGESTQPGSMTHALRALIIWTFETLQVKTQYLQVFSDNEQAVRLYRRCGFVDVKLNPLKKLVTQDAIKFIDMEKPQDTPDRYFLLMKLEHFDVSALQKVAREVRKDIMYMANRAKSAHVGGALSCVEILTALYFDIMRVDPKEPENPKNDRLIFSKAHDAKALYAVLCERGFFAKKVLDGYERDGGQLPGHSTRHCVPGVEASAGSLGHGLPIATGMAFIGKVDKKKHKIFAILSDGECDEGSTWEAILFAGHHKLDNLIAIVDYNKLQGFGFTKDVLDLEPFADKWRSFGWEVREANGHDFADLIPVLRNVPLQKNKPTVILAHTIKGLGGVPLHVNQISSQYKPPSDEEYATLIDELE